MRSPTELTAMFRARGLKVTPQRLCIFEVLHADESHPTAESVYAAAAAHMPTISLKTVYQTLNDLTEMGELSMLDVGTGASRFDPNVESSHHHLVCERCGKVRDLHADLGPLDVPETARQGFTLGTTEVVFRGVCAGCANGTQSQPHPPDQGASWLN
ncbi:MAG: Fur family transcriptional regulator [Acidimicrobiales bacterium]